MSYGSLVEMFVLAFKIKLDVYQMMIYDLCKPFLYDARNALTTFFLILHALCVHTRYSFVKFEACIRPNLTSI